MSFTFCQLRQNSGRKTTSTQKRICFQRQTNQFFSEFYKRLLFLSEQLFFSEHSAFSV